MKINPLQINYYSLLNRRLSELSRNSNQNTVEMKKESQFESFLRLYTTNGSNYSNWLTQAYFGTNGGAGVIWQENLINNGASSTVSKPTLYLNGSSLGTFGCVYGTNSLPPTQNTTNKIITYKTRISFNTIRNNSAYYIGLDNFAFVSNTTLGGSGIYIKLDKSVNNGLLQMGRISMGANTIKNTNIAIADNTYYDLEILYDKYNNQATIKINDVAIETFDISSDVTANQILRPSYFISSTSTSEATIKNIVIHNLFMEIDNTYV